MGRYNYMPMYAVDYGAVETIGSGNVLGDTSISTYKGYAADSGSVLVYPAFTGAANAANPSGIPAGRDIIAVRALHEHAQSGALGGNYGGWVCTFLRIGGQRQESTKVYSQDGFSGSFRVQMGSPLYKRGLEPWTAAEISAMSTDSGAATGTIGPNRNTRRCICATSAIAVVYEEPVPVPTVPFPANGQTIDTSSVNFSAQLAAVQMEQPVQAVFQVARDSGFTTDVRTFVGGLNQSEFPGSRSTYVSQVLQPSYTNLGPGLWYLRMKGRDYRGAAHESAWGATTTFTIAHPALPVPSLSAPLAGSISPTPYGIRSVNFAVQPAGARMVGATWQFSKVSDFSSGMVQWTNSTKGIWLIGNGSVVSYNPEPDAETAIGQNGDTVSVDDPSQYLSQGLWYARVRATDVYGQSGAWSSVQTFTVSHPPLAADPIPAMGAAFDQTAGPVKWSFTDPWAGDSQSSYRMRVFDLTDQLLQDTGKVMSTVPRATMSIPTSHLREQLKYLIQVWDRDDVVSSSEAEATFRLSLSPVIALAYPADGEQIVSGQPELSWTVGFAAPGITQKSFRIRFLRSDTGVAEFDTGTVMGTATTYLPPRPILKNLTGYQVEITVTDSEDLSGVLRRDFSTNFERPGYAPGYADSTMYTDSGYVTVYYPDADPDPFFFEWRVYRRLIGETEWTFAGAVQDPDQREFRDWLVAGDGMFEYTVTQAATRFGSIVESDYNPDPDQVPVSSDSYWFIVEGEEESNVELHHVTGDKYSDRQESNTYVIIGGGKRKVYGTHLGKEGSLTAQIRASANITAKEQVRVLRQLNRDSRPVIMRDPFGNLTTVALGEISVDRVAGVGNNEFVDIDVPYEEVM